MSDRPVPDPAFPGLEGDEGMIAAFVARENARTEAALTDAAFHRDVATAREIIDDPRRIGGIARRGAHLFTYRTTPDNPRGLWLRIPSEVPPTHDAPWETVFDLDAHCRGAGEDWHWRGAPTLWSDPTRVLICLSLGGSDRRAFREFDTIAKHFVPGGFDIPAERGDAAWRDADTLIWNTAEGPGAATASGWSRLCKRLSRGQALADAPILFEGDATDVAAGGYPYLDRDGQLALAFFREREIGQTGISLRRDGRPDLTVPSPGDTMVQHNATHAAWIAAERGQDAAGTLVLAEIDGPGRRVLFRPGDRSAIDGETLLMTSGWFLWVEHDNLAPRLMALDLRDPGAVPCALPLPVAAQTIGIGFLDAQPIATDETLQVHLSGMIQPPGIWTFSLQAGIAGVVWTRLVVQPPAFDATGFSVRLLIATSEDGTEIPYHLALPATAPPGDCPVLIHGYGGYGIPMMPWYLGAAGALWLARGGGYAVAHIRGGGEFGPAWHLPAKGAGRHRAFADFAAIASDLAARGISRPSRIGCHGGSNGGLLCGVMLTRYPDRFGAVWASVGVHDMMRFHLFPAGRAWIDEYGDPDDAAARDWLLGYSPIHNIRPAAEGAYPATLIDTGDHDDRVDPSHSRRFAAALAAAGHAPFFMQHSGGHGGGGGSDTQARETALGYAFLRHALGVG